MLNTITIGITTGDPSGIGPEVVAKSLRQFRTPAQTKIVVFGDALALADSGFKERKSHIQFVDHKFLKPSEMKYGVLSKKFGAISLAYLRSALDYLKKGHIDCLVTGPVNKKAIQLTGMTFTGHTEFLAQQFGIRRFTMLFVSKDLRVGVVTRHIALARVASVLTKGMISTAVGLTYDALRRDFKIRFPRIAVLGLNPHASDGGIMGTEEQRIIDPALRLFRNKIKNSGKILGPLSPDTVFHRALQGEFDAVMCMYHDQALIPFKLLHFNDGVNVTIGLPFVRTSCDHGTAFEIAGKNKADFHSMLSAIQLAYTLTKNRMPR